jgi:2-C-methyl-D-erythritol 2,4-cyclodiphosphate synthase
MSQPLLILGAIGAGDLGRHFPDNDPQFKDADSIALLAQIGKLARDGGWRLGNADLTIFAQAPKLKPYLETMRVRIASALECKASKINVKASSPEGIGALGRGDGMAAAAIVLLEAD